MRGEDHAHRPSRHVGKRLLHLRRVAVLCDAVCLHGLVCVAEVRALRGGAARAAHAGYRIGYHEVSRGDAALERGHGGKRRRGGVAAGRGDQHRLAVRPARGEPLEPGAVELWKPVHRLMQQVLARVRRPVPRLVRRGVTQAKVGGEVHDAHANLQQARRERKRRGVGDGEKREGAGACDELWVGPAQDDVGRALERRMDVCKARAGCLAVGRHAKLHAGVAKHQAAQLHPRESACPHDAYRSDIHDRPLQQSHKQWSKNLVFQVVWKTNTQMRRIERGFIYVEYS